jgi:CBS domain-containing protein
MHYGIFSSRITTSLDEAMDIMCSQQVTGLPVIDDHMYLYGIITEKDILNVIQTPNILESLVEQHMTRDVVTFSADTRLAEVCDFFINSGIHRVPIVNYDKLVGILSRADIIRKMITACKLSAQPCA